MNSVDHRKESFDSMSLTQRIQNSAARTSHITSARFYGVTASNPFKLEFLFEIYFKKGNPASALFLNLWSSGL